MNKQAEKKESVLGMAHTLSKAIDVAFDKNNPLPETESKMGKKITKPIEVAGEVLIVTGFCMKYFSRQWANKIDQKIDNKKAEKNAIPAAV